MKKMCNETVPVRVFIPKDLSSAGYLISKIKPIDKCIASIVKALDKGLIIMRGSCCGHGKKPGEIILQDGRKLTIEKW